MKVTCKGESEEIFVKDKFFKLFVLKVIHGGFVGFFMALFMEKIRHVIYRNNLGTLGEVLLWIIVVIFPIIWIYTFDKREEGLVEYNQTYKIPNPYVIGLSMAYFIVVMQWAERFLGLKFGFI